VQEVTHFKSKAPWAADVWKPVETKVKSAFTRTFNKTVGGCGVLLCWVVWMGV
jgi:formate/nitrite transporter FocA (FNT family)